MNKKSCNLSLIRFLFSCKMYKIKKIQRNIEIKKVASDAAVANLGENLISNDFFQRIRKYSIHQNLPKIHLNIRLQQSVIILS
jgi:hypothetical protein